MSSSKVKFLSILISFFSTIFLSSCVETKKIVYFQNINNDEMNVKVIVPKAKTLQPNDILAIVVNSLSEESNTLFNLPNINSLTVSNFSSNMGMGRAQPLGYRIDSLGFISMPLIGKIKIKDLSVQTASDSLENRLAKFLKEPTVSIRILNHKFSILGEVNRPGVYNLIEDYISIPEAIGMAGDLTIFGRRDNILLIRESVEKGREMIRLDLTSKDLLSSKYYYLGQNDILYIEPLKTRATSTDQNYQLVPIFTGIVSALGILILNLK